MQPLHDSPGVFELTCPVVFVVNDPYAPYMSVTMQSVIDNASARNQYIFYVLHLDLREETMERLNRHIQKTPNCSIKFVDVSSYLEGWTLLTTGWPVEIYFKQMAPYILTGHDTLLYLDSDIVVNIDVAQLFEINLGKNVLAAARDITLIGLFHASLKWFGKMLPKSRRPADIMADLKNPDDYFNTGVLLFNTPAFRSEINFNELMDACTRKWRFPDQDLLNVFCEGKTQLLPMKYNFQVRCWSGTSYLPERFHAEYAEAKENPALIHLMHKPWKFAYTTRFFPYFWMYALRSPYFNELSRTMRGNGCMCDFAEEPFSVRLKRLLKEGKKGRRLALTTFLKCGLCRQHLS